VARRRIDALARRVPLDAPWTAPGAAALDARTITSWIDSPWNVPSRTVRTLLAMTMTELFTADPSEVSLLHMLFHFHSAGGFVRQTSIEGGTQQDRIVGGMQTILDGVAHVSATASGSGLRCARSARTRPASTSCPIGWPCGRRA
jgi:monoamine oxidase